MIRYQDSGTMILGRPIDGDKSDYLAALVWTSQAKYGQRIVPAELWVGENVVEGETLFVVRQGRDGRDAIELTAASVESIEKRWGQTVYKLRVANEENIMPGDSGGGLWQGGRFVGNMWKSKFTYGWNWDAMALEKQWTETSFAASLPDFVDEPPQRLETKEIADDVESISGGQEY
jgi:hypothetical protein